MQINCFVLYSTQNVHFNIIWSKKFKTLLVILWFSHWVCLSASEISWPPLEVAALFLVTWANPGYPCFPNIRHECFVYCQPIRWPITGKIIKNSSSHTLLLLCSRVLISPSSSDLIATIMKYKILEFQGHHRCPFILVLILVELCLWWMFLHI